MKKYSTHHSTVNATASECIKFITALKYSNDYLGHLLNQNDGGHAELYGFTNRRCCVVLNQVLPHIQVFQ